MPVGRCGGRGGGVGGGDGDDGERARERPGDGRVQTNILADSRPPPPRPGERLKHSPPSRGNIIHLSRTHEPPPPCTRNNY